MITWIRICVLTCRIAENTLILPQFVIVTLPGMEMNEPVRSILGRIMSAASRSASDIPPRWSAVEATTDRQKAVRKRPQTAGKRSKAVQSGRGQPKTGTPRYSR